MIIDNELNSMNAKRREIADVRRSGTYQRILRMIVEDAIATLPTDCFDLFGYEVFPFFQDKLIEMRKKGQAFLVYDPTSSIFYEEVDRRVVGNDIQYWIKEIGSTVERQVNESWVLYFGDAIDSLKARFSPSENERQDILQYEDTLIGISEDYKNSFKDVYRFKNYNDNKLPHEARLFKDKISSILGRKKNHAIFLDKEDEIGHDKRDISDLSWMLDEFKFKICLNHSIPYSRLFGDAPSGMNSTGEGDRINWNYQLRFFQARRIFPQLKRLASMLGKEDSFNKIQIEPIEAYDKDLESIIAQRTVRDVIDAWSSDLIDDETAKSLIATTFNLTPVREK